MIKGAEAILPYQYGQLQGTYQDTSQKSKREMYLFMVFGSFLLIDLGISYLCTLFVPFAIANF